MRSFITNPTNLQACARLRKNQGFPLLANSNNCRFSRMHFITETCLLHFHSYDLFIYLLISCFVFTHVASSTRILFCFFITHIEGFFFYSYRGFLFLLMSLVSFLLMSLVSFLLMSLVSFLLMSLVSYLQHVTLQL